MPSSVVSNSQISTFKRCKRKYWLTYQRCLKPVHFPLTGARQLGTRMHSALEVHKEHGLEAALQWLADLAETEIQSVGEESFVADSIKKETSMVVAMLTGYDEWIASGADSDFEYISTEQLLRTRSPIEGVELIGKLDVVLKRKSSGAVGFMDYKTVGDLQTPLKYLGMNEQFRMYALMQRLAGGEELSFHIYRMLKKSMHTERATPPFFADYEVYINDAELKAMWERLYGELTDILAFEQRMEEHPELHRSIAYPTPTTDCSWDCDFYSVCPLFDDDRSDPEHILAMNYYTGDPHSHYGDQLRSSS